MVVAAAATDRKQTKRQILQLYYNNIKFLLQRTNIVVFLGFLLYN